MVNSASQASEVSQVSDAPEQAMDYDTFWQKNNAYGTASPEGQLMVRIMNWFTGEGKKVRDKYDAYLTNLNNRNEAKAVQSARAWDNYMDSTKYFRAFHDLERAGVNPYLLLNSGSTPGAGSVSSPKASYSKAGTRDAESNTKGRDFALILLAIARIAAAMAA